MLGKLVIISLITIALINLFNIGGRNLIIFLLCLELLFFSCAVLGIVVFYSAGVNAYGNYDIIFFSIGVTVIAAAESAVGLALVAVVHDNSNSIKIKAFSLL